MQDLVTALQYTLLGVYFDPCKPERQYPKVFNCIHLHLQLRIRRQPPFRKNMFFLNKQYFFCKEICCYSEKNKLNFLKVCIGNAVLNTFLAFANAWSYFNI